MKNLRTIFALLAALAVPSRAVPGRPVGHPHFQATAFSLHGFTKSGIPARVGVVAADTRVLPLGTRIRVTGAGPYSGEYLVADTGAKVLGRHIDIFIPSWAEAKQFGKKLVSVIVLKWGSGAAS
ncbi:MAG: 3D domain-containing protein [Acidobacteriia bacterium]|nr:3D domain-containing protein [Terriglobia bacterium]